MRLNYCLRAVSPREVHSGTVVAFTKSQAPIVRLGGSRRMSRSVCLAALAGVLFGGILVSCNRQTNSVTTASSEAADGEVHRVPEPLVLSLRHQLSDGGFAVADFDGGVPPQIESTRLIEATTNVPVHNYRIRVFDEADRAMVSDDVATEGDHLDYQIHFPTPLQAGHRYVLLLDAQTGDSILDAQGRPQPEQRLEFEVAGPREKAPAVAPASKKRRRRRHGLLLIPELRGAQSKVERASLAGNLLGQDAKEAD